MAKRFADVETTMANGFENVETMAKKLEDVGTTMAERFARLESKLTG
jgi:hypothetical protein